MLKLYRYVDVDWGRDQNIRKLIPGYIFILAGGAINWGLKGQQTISLLLIKVKYIAIISIFQEAL